MSVATGRRGNRPFDHVRVHMDPGSRPPLKTIGHYQITRTLGQGGMGIVYAAWDNRLNRAVALKTIRATDSDPTADERLRREARAGARVNHPNICQLYDMGSEEGQFYIAMELLEGESLASRLEDGPLPLKDAVGIALSVLSALDALHTHGLIHRDLKPSNIFLTPHAVKLLDFGLALSIGAGDWQTRLTTPGTVVGTPRYLSPEQLLEEPVDHRTDVFAAGAVLYEMITGRPAFDAETMPKLVHAVAYENPPGLDGPPAVVAVDRVIHKALAKRPQDRYSSARAMAEDLRAAMLLVDSGAASPAPRRMTRLIVLPFRILRPDSEIDFLSFSLSDALSTSLSGIGSLLVRSNLTASRFCSDPLDLEALAKADVDAVLTGTILRAEDQLSVTAQLADVPSGDVRWSQTMRVRLGDIFQLQDALTSRIVESLAVPLTARDRQALARDVPASAKAYEFYLRANQLAYEAKNWIVARDLYRQCLEHDPDYAPAWARLARIYRLIGMYSGDVTGDPYALAEEAFRRALALNPDLSIAHNLYTVVELETGRARQAMLRLLECTRRRSGDPELFAGLVQACRYAGLQRPAIVAHEHAVRLEPQIRTGVCHAYFTAGEYEKAIAHDHDDPPIVTTLALDLMGQHDRAIAHAREQVVPGMPALFRLFYELTLACLEARGNGHAIADEILAKWRLRDPCATFYLARMLAASRHPRALSMFKRAIEGGYHCYSFVTHDPWLDSLRGNTEFNRVVQLAEEGYRDAAGAFVAAGGEKLLGALE
jgi:serine/threonine protein kinase/tetratricopeptide (TPR) repeat protein